MEKHYNADLETSELLELQQSVGHLPARNAAHFALTVGLSLFIFLGGILLWALPRESFSENENRLLAGPPSFNIQNLLSGRFTSQISDFYSDHFPLRDGFVSLSSYTELLLGRREANNVVVGADGRLAERRDDTSADRRGLENSSYAIYELSESFGLPTTVAMIPDALTAQSELFGIAVTERGRLRSDVVYLNQNVHASYYFKTDHHRTAEGSYAVYLALGEALGYSPYPEADFSRETVSEAFYGTAWSRSGLYLTPPDTLELWRYDGDDSYRISGDLTQAGFYDPSKLEGKDKYAVFLSGNHGLLRIENGEEKPRLLIIKDSFANSVIPFLARHFDLTVVDPRYFHGDLKSSAAECDRVLFLYGINSLMTDRDLVRLTLEQDQWAEPYGSAHFILKGIPFQVIESDQAFFLKTTTAAPLTIAIRAANTPMPPHPFSGAGSVTGASVVVSTGSVGSSTSSVVVTGAT